MQSRLYIITLLLLLNGCSFIYTYDDNLPQRIDQWMLEGKYKTALNAITYIKTDHKYYSAIQLQKKRILKYLINYENDAILKSTQLAKQGSWIDAFKFIDEVSENISDNSKILSHRAILFQQRNEKIKLYETEVLNKQAINLAEKIKLYDDIKKMVAPNEKNNLNILAFDELRNKTTLQLAEQSERQYKDGFYNKAKTSVDLALDLRPDKELLLRLNKIKHLVKKELDIKTRHFVKAAQALLTKLSQGYSHAILKETKETISWLKDNKENENSYKMLISKLDKHLQTGADRYFKAASKLYSKGKIQEALSIWLRLKELDPEYPNLISHISRAEKILQKLNRITNQK